MLDGDASRILATLRRGGLTGPFLGGDAIGDEVLSRGLPQRHAYDLVWRHALDVDATGERLAFGSTSGGLWISEDAGETWTAPEARLPPIAAVRFAGA